MADYSTIYTLAGTGSIVFNSGTLFQGSTTDLYWIANIRGLDGPAIRAPVDDVPYGDGGIIHKFWKGPRRVAIEGHLIVQSVAQADCQAVFNDMEDDLNGVLDSIIQSTGTLIWTPAGGTSQMLFVRNEIGVEYQPTDNYRLRSFTFGLVSEEADPIPST